jgi:hypothetical protein
MGKYSYPSQRFETKTWVKQALPMPPDRRLVTKKDSMEPLEPISREFAVSNYIEAGLWSAIAVGFLIQAIRLRRRDRRLCVIGFVAFLAFGGSDWVEAHTGAWWHPWWLLVWKGACIAVFLGLLVAYVRARVHAGKGFFGRGKLQDALPKQSS